MCNRSRRRGSASVMRAWCNVWSRTSRSPCSSRALWTSGPPGWTTWSLRSSSLTRAVAASPKLHASSCWSGPSTGNPPLHSEESSPFLSPSIWPFGFLLAAPWLSETSPCAVQPVLVPSTWFACCMMNTCSTWWNTEWLRPQEKPLLLSWERYEKILHTDLTAENIFSNSLSSSNHSSVTWAPWCPRSWIKVSPLMRVRQHNYIFI